MTSSGGDTGTTTSTSSASSSPPHPCNDSLGTPQTDTLPCGASQAKQGGTEFALLELWGAAGKLGTATLASVGPSAEALYSFTDRAAVPEFSYCPGTSGEGCVHADVTRTWGTVSLGGLPDNFSGASLPPGWNGFLLTGSNLKTTAWAEAGIGSTAPSVSVQGSLSYYDGRGYTPLPLLGGAPLSIPIPAVHAEQVVSGKLFTVDMEASLTTGGTTIDPPVGCAPPCTHNDASAVVESPIVGQIKYVYTFDGSTVATLIMKVDLGAVQAKGTYKPAPSGA